MVQPKTVVWAFIVTAPVLAYWFFYFDFAPMPEGSSGLAKGMLLILLTGLSLFSFVISLILAIRKRNEIGWWLVSVFTFTPLLRLLFAGVVILLEVNT